jgi:hypothetical protein
VYLINHLVCQYKSNQTPNNHHIVSKANWSGVLIPLESTPWNNAFCSIFSGIAFTHALAIDDIIFLVNHQALIHFTRLRDCVRLFVAELIAQKFNHIDMVSGNHHLILLVRLYHKSQIDCVHLVGFRSDVFETSAASNSDIKFSLASCCHIIPAGYWNIEEPTLFITAKKFFADGLVLNLTHVSSSRACFDKKSCGVSCFVNNDTSHPLELTTHFSKNEFTTSYHLFSTSFSINLTTSLLLIHSFHLVTCSLIISNSL